MIHNNKVYANADEKFVKTTIVYANDDKILFYDGDFMKPVLTTELMDLLLNGVIIFSSSGGINMYIQPTIMDEFSGLGAHITGSNPIWYKATAPTEE